MENIKLPVNSSAASLYGNGKYAGEFQKEAGKKNLDMVVANNLKVAGAGFETDTNVVTMITDTEVLELPIMNKEGCIPHYRPDFIYAEH